MYKFMIESIWQILFWRQHFLSEIQYGALATLRANMQILPTDTTIKHHLHLFWDIWILCGWVHYRQFYGSINNTLVATYSTCLCLAWPYGTGTKWVCVEPLPGHSWVKLTIFLRISIMIEYISMMIECDKHTKWPNGLINMLILFT